MFLKTFYSSMLLVVENFKWFQESKNNIYFNEIKVKNFFLRF